MYAPWMLGFGSNMAPVPRGVPLQIGVVCKHRFTTYSLRPPQNPTYMGIEGLFGFEYGDTAWRGIIINAVVVPTLSAHYTVVPGMGLASCKAQSSQY